MEARSPTAAPSAPLSPHELAQQRVHEARVASLPPLTPADRRHSRRILFERFQQSKAMEKRSITRISVALALVMGYQYLSRRMSDDVG